MAKKQMVGKLLSVPVSYGGVSIGKETVRVGLKISRKHMKLPQADKLFVGKRLAGSLIVGTNGDEAGQKKMLDDMLTTLEGTFDVTRFGVSPDFYSTGATFSLASMYHRAGIKPGTAAFHFHHVTGDESWKCRMHNFEN